MIKANNPQLRSWVAVAKNSDFSIQNLPFGIFKTEQGEVRAGSRIGDKVIDLHALFILGYLKNLPFVATDFKTDALNSIMQKGKKATSDLRNRLSKLFQAENDDLAKNKVHIDQILVDNQQVEMLLPIKVGDYTDFYSSRPHAENVGTMFRGKENALKPNYLWLPVGYHGRASSIIPSHQKIKRPKGQFNDKNEEQPHFGLTQRLDYELEMAFVTYEGKPLGENISTEEAEDYVFGMCLMNDWSARDIQKWEYIPLGPFLGKSFATSISPWIITMDALEPFKTEGPSQNPEVLSYLKYKENSHYNIDLQVSILPENGEETVVCNTNYKYMYWNIAQQLAHHTINGCNIRCGDIMGSGTISGKEKGMFGSMLETTWNGENPIELKDGSTRRFIEDYDTVIMKGNCRANGIQIGFGEVSNKIIPNE